MEPTVPTGAPIFTIEPWLMSSQRQTSPPFLPPKYSFTPAVDPPRCTASEPCRRTTGGDQPVERPVIVGPPVISGELVSSLKDQTKLSEQALVRLEKLLNELLTESARNNCKSEALQVPQWIQTKYLMDALSSLISLSRELCPRRISGVRPL